MPRFTAVSFCTAGPYEAELHRLAASCRKFDVSLACEVIPSKGSWAKNCAYKAQFIREQLATFREPVVWLDADSELVAYPHAFDVLETDFAAFRLEHPGGRKELMSGTLFFRPTHATHKLVDHWTAECERNPERWDQKSLELVLPDHQYCTIHWLPESYCWIENPVHRRTAIANPVIVQHQASRRLKRLMKTPART